MLNVKYHCAVIDKRLVQVSVGKKAGVHTVIILVHSYAIVDTPWILFQKRQITKARGII